MVTRRTPGTLGLAFAVVLIAFTVGCEARSNALSEATTDCATCHGHPPATNAHAIHFKADTGSGIPHAQFECLQCHRDIESMNQADHILRADGTAVTTPAEVRFDDAEALASVTQQGASRPGAPAYDPASRTCSNIYCHGTGLRAPVAGALASPTWTTPSGGLQCDSCHGNPPANHPVGAPGNCAQCHGDAMEATGKPNPAKHVNGTVDLIPNVTTSCASCHGDRSANVLPGDPRSAPPTDAEGRDGSDPAATSIGAHQNHVVAGVLGVAVACSECHPVPSTIFASGHFDGKVDVAFGPLASKGGLTPVYNSDQTCSNVYCHGSFPRSKATLPPPAPAWRGGDAAVACGSCHDLPPPAPAHVVVDVVAQGCSVSTNPVVACHPAPGAGKPGYSFDPASGTGTVDPKLHIDGKVCPPFCGP